MSKKKYFVALIALNTVLLALAASLDYQRRVHGHFDSNDTKRTPLAGPSGKFGPVIETVLTAPKEETSVNILDLETGRTLRQPPVEYFNSSAEAIKGWIRSNGLDLSSFVWPGGAACVTYDMTIVPIEAKRWNETKEQDLVDSPTLAPVPHSPRRLLVLGHDRPTTFIFRTGEGTLGMLQLVSSDGHLRGVKIRYKLIHPAKSVATLAGV